MFVCAWNHVGADAALCDDPILDKEVASCLLSLHESLFFLQRVWVHSLLTPMSNSLHHIRGSLTKRQQRPDIGRHTKTAHLNPLEKYCTEPYNINIY